MDDIRRQQEDFIRKLQMEYLTHKLRSMVYRKMKYIKISKDIAEKKKKKIQLLGQKFGIATMFETGVRQFVQEYFWNECGLPNMSYKDDEQRRVQWNYDAWYLLYRGTHIMCDGRKYAVANNNPSTKTVCVFGSSFLMSYQDISLIDDYDWE